MITSAQFANPDSTAVIVTTDDRGAVAIQLTGDDNSNGLRWEYLAWATSNTPSAYVVPPVDYFALAEQHVLKSFTPTGQMKLKLWWDTKDHALIPKLAAVFAWQDAVTLVAAQGSSAFPAPPHTFSEIAAESLAIP